MQRISNLKFRVRRIVAAGRRTNDYTFADQGYSLPRGADTLLEMAVTRSVKPQSGFTLVELMVTLSVLAILAAVALPSFQDTIRLNRVSTENNELIAALNLARTEAIKTRSFAELCASADGTACGVDWSQGWMVWSDINRNGALDAGTEVVRFERADPQVTAVANIAGIDAGTSAVRYNGRGQPVLPAGTVFPANVITLHPLTCATGAEHLRNILIARTGQIRTLRGVCS